MNYLPHTLSWAVRLCNPLTNRAKPGQKHYLRSIIYGMDLGALTVDHPEIKYFFGKVTMYSHFHNEARNLIQYFFRKYFRDKENLIYPKEPVEFDFDVEEMKKVFNGENYNEDYKILVQSVRQYGENVPPLINAYMNLSPSMKTFGTVNNEKFGNVLETGIIVTIDDIYGVKRDRHIETYIQDKENGEWPEPE